MRSGLIRGKSGVQTVYDVFAVAPLGAGVVDTTAGSTLVTGYFTGQELKNLLEFFLVDNPAHPGEYSPSDDCFNDVGAFMHQTSREGRRS